MQMPYTAMQIVSEIMRQCNLERIWMTNFRLQTTLYYIQTKALKETGNPVFEDDFEAWRGGPVVRDVYREFMRYVGLGIEFDDPVLKKNRVPIDRKTSKIVHDVLVLTRNFGAWDLAYRAKKTAAYRWSYIGGMTIPISKNKIKELGEMNLEMED